MTAWDHAEDDQGAIVGRVARRASLDATLRERWYAKAFAADAAVRSADSIMQARVMITRDQMRRLSVSASPTAAREPPRTANNLATESTAADGLSARSLVDAFLPAPLGVDTTRPVASRAAVDTAAEHLAPATTGNWDGKEPKRVGGDDQNSLGGPSHTRGGDSGGGDSTGGGSSLDSTVGGGSGGGGCEGESGDASGGGGGGGSSRSSATESVASSISGADNSFAPGRSAAAVASSPNTALYLAVVLSTFSGSAFTQAPAWSGTTGFTAWRRKVRTWLCVTSVPPN